MAYERWKRRLWIIDGHNAIFALPRLCQLQRDGDKQQARHELEALLEPFARSLRRCMVVVYDGNEMLRNPDAGERGGLQTQYSQPPEEADDRIVFLAEQALGRGESVAIVTNDRRSLCPRLSSEAQVLAVEEFRDRFLHAQRSDGEEKQISAEDQREIASMFMARESEIQDSARQGARRREREAAGRWQTRVGVAGAGGSGESESPHAMEAERHARRIRADRGQPNVRHLGSEGEPAGKVGAARGGHDPAPGGATGESEEAKRVRAAKRRRGLRQQKRRLEQRRRRQSH